MKKLFGLLLIAIMAMLLTQPVAAKETPEGKVPIFLSADTGGGAFIQASEIQSQLAFEINRIPTVDFVLQVFEVDKVISCKTSRVALRQDIATKLNKPIPITLFGRGYTTSKLSAKTKMLSMVDQGNLPRSC